MEDAQTKRHNPSSLRKWYHFHLFKRLALTVVNELNPHVALIG